MASVRMTNDLRYRITTRATEVFKAANPLSEILSDEMHETIRSSLKNSPYQKYMEATTKLREYEVLKDNLKTKNEMQNLPESGPLPYSGYPMLNKGAYPGIYTVTAVRFLYPSNTSEATSAEIISNLCQNRASDYDYWSSTEINLKSPLALYFPTEENSPSITVSWEEIDVKQRSNVMRAVLGCVMARQKREQDLRSYRGQIQDLVAECNTVKQMLDAWPAGENLLPSQVIEKLHQKADKVNRVKQVKEKINFDTAAANQVILTAKLAS